MLSSRAIQTSPLFPFISGSRVVKTLTPQALEVQELMSVDDDDDPIMQKISADSAVVMQGRSQRQPTHFMRIYIGMSLSKFMFAGLLPPSCLFQEQEIGFIPCCDVCC